jgi:hypothetical protein
MILPQCGSALPHLLWICFYPAPFGSCLRVLRGMERIDRFGAYVHVPGRRTFKNRTFTEYFWLHMDIGHPANA